MKGKNSYRRERDRMSSCLSCRRCGEKLKIEYIETSVLVVCPRCRIEHRRVSNEEFLKEIKVFIFENNGSEYNGSLHRRDRGNC
jgi:hypothetical protein